MPRYRHKMPARNIGIENVVLLKPVESLLLTRSMLQPYRVIKTVYPFHGQLLPSHRRRPGRRLHHGRRDRRALALRRSRDRTRPGVRRRRGRARGRERGGGAPRRSAARVASGPRSSTAPRGCSGSAPRSSPASSPRRRPSRSRPRASRPTRAVSTFTFAATEARRLAGEMVPLDAADVGRGQARFHPARAHRRGRRHQPVQLPAEPGGAQAGAGDRRRVPGGAQAGLADAAVGDRAGRAAARRVRPARRPPQRGHRRRRHRRQRHRRRPRRRADHLHRLAGGRVGHPGRARRTRRWASSSATTRPSSSSPTATSTTAATKISVAGFSHAGQSCISTQRVYVHDDDRRRVPRRAASRGRRADGGRPARRGHRRVGADLPGRARSGRVVDRRGGRRRGQGRGRRHRAQRRARPDGAHDVATRHEGVQPGGVRPGGRRSRRTPTSTTPSAWPTTPATACRPPSSPATCRSPCVPRASSTSAACWSTRCRPGAPTRCPTAACATAATPGRARTTPSTR